MLWSQIVQNATKLLVGKSLDINPHAPWSIEWVIQLYQSFVIVGADMDKFLRDSLRSVNAIVLSSNGEQE